MFASSIKQRHTSKRTKQRDKRLQSMDTSPIITAYEHVTQTSSTSTPVTSTLMVTTAVLYNQLLAAGIGEQ